MEHNISRCKKIFSLLFLLLLPGLFWGQETEPEQDTGASTALHYLNFQGGISNRYVYRATRIPQGEVSDQDMYQDLYLDISRIHPKIPGTNILEFYFSAAVKEDLEGDINRSSFFPFEDVADSRKSNIMGQVYEAYLDINRLDPVFSRLRVGRQAGTRDQPLFFDGMNLNLSFNPYLDLTLYGGAAVHFQEIGFAEGTDLLAGAGIDYYPFPSSSLSLDYLYVKDERNVVLTSNQYNHLLTFSLGQYFYPLFAFQGKFRLLDAYPRDLQLKGTFTIPSWALELTTVSLSQFTVQRELSSEFSDYYDLLGPFYPYQSFDIRARKLFGPHLGLDLGLFLRLLYDNRNQGPFNRQYNRYYTVFDLMDLFIKGLTFAFSGEIWTSGDKQFYATGIDVSHTLAGRGRGKTKIALGSYFSLYKYDYYTQFGEQQGVQTYYAKIRLPLGDNFSFSGSYQFESSLEPYHTLELSGRYDF